MPKNTFQLPTTYRETRELWELLAVEIKDIELQLGDKYRKSDSGEVMSLSVFNRWRHGALRALRIKFKQRAELEKHMRNLRLKEMSSRIKEGLNPNNPWELLELCLSILKAICHRYGWDNITEIEQDAIDFINLCIGMSHMPKDSEP